MKILVLNNLYPPHHAGTYDFRCQTVADALRLRGHNVHVLTSRHGIGSEQRGPDIDRRLELNGVYDHPLVTRYKDLRRLELQNHEAVRETIAAFQPDLIHVFSLHGVSKSLIFTLRNARLPTVYDVADYWLADGVREDPWLRWWNNPAAPFGSSFRRGTLELLGRRGQLDTLAPTRMMKGFDRIPGLYAPQTTANSIAAFRFDRLYFASQSLKHATEEAGFRVNHADVIYPGIPTQSFVNDVKPPSAPFSKLLIVATLDGKSGVLTAVKAVCLARENKIKMSLGIYGRGDSDYIAQLRSYIAMHQVHVDFLPVSNLVRDLPSLYRKYDGVLHTAEWNQPYSLTPLESMASGVPVIGTTIGGAGELFRHGENALTYMPGDEADLARRLQELHEQPELRCRMADNAQQEVLAKYNETAVMDRIENHLQTSLEVWAHDAT
ncbi:MAG TPA: glycosyltransferase family 4 protein [Candidatus Binatia bacterium]|nr:glycosyltransferase family 4 protein [Candidatus Binatia bacterium]